MSAVEKQTEAEPQAVVEAPEESRVPVAQCEIDEIIRKRVYGAVALGMAPLPMVDLLGLYALQVELVSALAKKHNVPFKPDMVKALLGSLVGSVLPVSLAPAFFSLFKLIPVIGWTAGASTMCIIGGASTYAVGRVFDKHFASGGTLLNVETDKLRTAFKEKYEEGKEYVGKLRKKSTAAKEEAPEPQAAG